MKSIFKIELFVFLNSFKDVNILFLFIYSIIVVFISLVASFPPGVITVSTETFIIFPLYMAMKKGMTQQNAGVFMMVQQMNSIVKTTTMITRVRESDFPL